MMMSWDSAFDRTLDKIPQSLGRICGRHIHNVLDVTYLCEITSTELGLNKNNRL